MQERSGHIDVDGYKVWYRQVGTGGATPLLLLHGGPGAGHYYLEPLSILADERPVIFFDQLGCGQSDIPDDTSLWRIERFCGEIDQVRAALGLTEVHLLGQSWGGWLGIEYLLGEPRGVSSLVLASTSASLPQFVAEAEKLKAALPAEMYATMQRCEADGDYENSDYLAAVDEFYARHLCRLDPFPECLVASAECVHHNIVYETMNGPNEFAVIGNLKDWDRRDRLGEISLPTLITVGRFDEITPACAETMRQGIPGSELVVFEHSAHVAHLEEPEIYAQTVRDFLRRND